MLLAATGMRISEALALETRHFINGGRTIVVEQQVEKDCPRIKTKLKTDASWRESRSASRRSGVSDEVRERKVRTDLERQTITLPTCMVISLTIGSIRGSQNSDSSQPGCGWHQFKRFRNSWLRHQPKDAKKTCGSSGSPTSRRKWVNSIQHLKKTSQLGSLRRNVSATVLYCRGKLFQMFQEKGCLSVFEKLRQLVY